MRSVISTGQRLEIIIPPSRDKTLSVQHQFTSGGHNHPFFHYGPVLSHEKVSVQEPLAWVHAASRNSGCQTGDGILCNPMVEHQPHGLRPRRDAKGSACKYRMNLTQEPIVLFQKKLTHPNVSFDACAIIERTQAVIVPMLLEGLYLPPLYPAPSVAYFMLPKRQSRK